MPFVSDDPKTTARQMVRDSDVETASAFAGLAANECDAESGDHLFWLAVLRHIKGDEEPVTTTEADVNRKPHREFCAICGRVSRISFYVPEDVWELATHTSRRQDIHCLACFTEQADERGVDWSRGMQFYPMSRIRFENEVAGRPRSVDEQLNAIDFDRLSREAGGVGKDNAPDDEERPYPPIPPERRAPGCWVHDTTQPDCDMCQACQYPDGPSGVLHYRADLLDYLRTDPALSDALRNELARTASAIRHAAVEVTQGNTPVSSVTGWLIERPTQRTHPEYWAGGDHFTMDAGLALRFARRTDAETAMKRSSQTTFKSGEWKAVEHMWGSDVADLVSFPAYAPTVAPFKRFDEGTFTVIVNGAECLVGGIVGYEDVVRLAGKKPDRLWTIVYEKAEADDSGGTSGVLAPHSDPIAVRDGTQFDVVDTSRA